MGMKALSCEAVSIPFARLRAATTLLVPTSIPAGAAPAFSISSSRSSTSWATFHRWSLRSSMLLSSCRRGRLRPAGGGRLVGLALLAHPAVVELLALAAEILDGAARLRRFLGQRALRLAHARPRLAHDLQELLVVTEAEQRHRGRGARVLVGKAERLEGEPAGPVDVMADEVLLRVHAGEAVGHAHVGRDRPPRAQVIRQVASGQELGLGDRQRVPALPPGLERDAE